MSKYKTLGMMKDAGMGKDTNALMAGGSGVPYLLANQRSKYLVTVSVNNRLAQGQFLLNTASGPTGQFIFVMDGDGKIYSASKTEVTHHSSFLAGGAVAAAGWWRVEYGALLSIRNDSGHYQPPFDYTKQVLVELKKRGMDISGVEQNWTGSDSATATKQVNALRKKGQNIGFNRIGPKGVVRGTF
jgi:hypothetical protein